MENSEILKDLRKIIETLYLLSIGVPPSRVRKRYFDAASSLDLLFTNAPLQANWRYVTRAETRSRREERAFELLQKCVKAYESLATDPEVAKLARRYPGVCAPAVGELQRQFRRERKIWFKRGLTLGLLKIATSGAEGSNSKLFAPFRNTRRAAVFVAVLLVVVLSALATICMKFVNREPPHKQAKGLEKESKSTGTLATVHDSHSSDAAGIRISSALQYGGQSFQDVAEDICILVDRDILERARVSPQVYVDLNKSQDPADRSRRVVLAHMTPSNNEGNSIAFVASVSDYHGPLEWKAMWPLDRLRIVVESGKRMLCQKHFLTAVNYLSERPQALRTMRRRLAGSVMPGPDGAWNLESVNQPAILTSYCICSAHAATTVIASFETVASQDDGSAHVHATGGGGVSVTAQLGGETRKTWMEYDGLRSPEYAFQSSVNNTIRLDIDGRSAAFGIGESYFAPITVPGIPGGEIEFAASHSNVKLKSLFQTLRLAIPTGGS